MHCGRTEPPLCCLGNFAYYQRHPEIVARRDGPTGSTSQLVSSQSKLGRTEGRCHLQSLVLVDEEWLAVELK